MAINITVNTADATDAELTALGRMFIELGNDGLADAKKEQWPVTVDKPGPVPPADGGAPEVEPGEEEKPEAPKEVTATPEPQVEDAPVVDENGVAKNPDFCANAKDPFYGSGKRKGQWKKGKGVSDEDYDAWYQSQLPTQSASTPQAETSQPDPASVGFTSQAPAPQAEQLTWPGVLKQIAAAKQAGTVDQAMITQALSDCGVEGPFPTLASQPDKFSTFLTALGL